ncbi:CheR family methyltransferase [Reinekea sp.]|jgi:chemotaxis protein methyltransferase CheR|uniref:CheR family methyltransferase n=1 Tax=Reinekea sp. TaxID=1970455 RepID=UPI002A807BB9|nr:CheR family methyltransferase [Reinekea sp.]
MEREFSFTRKHFDQVRAKLYELAGITLATSKDALVYSRLVRRIRNLNLGGFSDYFVYLDKTPSETQEFINALTTNLTSFFREEHHFEILKQFLAHRSGKVKIWCVASSTGEEAYSIAIAVAEHYGRFDTPVEIIASDIDSHVLATASAGVYKLDRIESISPERRKQFFHRGNGSQSGNVRVVPELKRMVKFAKINLLDEKWPITSEVDVIFCRNVMIYFNKQTQLAVLTRLVALLPTDGIYIAGHSENFSTFPQVVRLAGQTTYCPGGALR